MPAYAGGYRTVQNGVAVGVFKEGLKMQCCRRLRDMLPAIEPYWQLQACKQGWVDNVRKSQLDLQHEGWFCYYSSRMLARWQVR